MSRCTAALTATSSTLLLLLLLFLSSNLLLPLDRILSYRTCRPPKNLTLLKESLEENVFGQHIAVRVILGSLSRRWGQADKVLPEKPLVMSFHGWTGSGKNHVARFLAEALFAPDGLTSPHVHLIVSTLHFPTQGHDDGGRVRQRQREQLRDWVRGNVSLCPDSLFIFDEVDKMPAGVLDALKPYMDYHQSVDGVDFRKAIFVLLSNTGGRDITDFALKVWQMGRSRLSIRYADLEPLVSSGAFNEDHIRRRKGHEADGRDGGGGGGGGLYHSAIIDHNLVDLYVPFLPLEIGHVRQCVVKELRLRGLPEENHRVLADQVVDQLTFWPPDQGVFASSGCKRIAPRVDELYYDTGSDSPPEQVRQEL